MQLTIAPCSHPFLSKKFVLVNAMKIQTYGNEFSSKFRVVLPVLVGNIDDFLVTAFITGRAVQ